jgi:transcriptional regulator with XRE-family HTH domain
MTASQNGMSLRQIAKALGVSHTLLSLWRQGKRTLSPELATRYYSMVESGYNESGYNDQAPNLSTPSSSYGPVAQFGQSIGLLIRVSRVRIPAGPPPLSTA